jgi:hypothetical protein
MHLFVKIFGPIILGILFIYAKPIDSKIIDFSLYMNKRDSSKEEKQKIKDDISSSSLLMYRISIIVSAATLLSLYFI